MHLKEWLLQMLLVGRKRMHRWRRRMLLVGRKRMHRWRRRLFRRVLVLNATIIYRRNTGKRINQLAFRINLAEALF
jgi:hypothetical protein